MALSQEILQDLAEKLEALQKLEGITVDICGSWLWIGGDTKPHKDAIKALGCRWAAKKKLWYYHSGPYMRRGKKHFTKEEINEKYGCEKVF